MFLKYQILHANCGCVAHIEWDADDVTHYVALDPDVEVTASDHPLVAGHRVLRGDRRAPGWRHTGRLAHHKWPSLLPRSALKRVECPAHASADHHEHLAKLRVPSD